MQKKLTITIDERVYAGLHIVVGRRRISRFIESLVRPHVIGKDLEIAYKQMAQEEAARSGGARVGRSHDGRRSR